MARGTSPITPAMVEEIIKIASNPKKAVAPKLFTFVPSILIPKPKPVNDLSTPAKFRANRKLLELINNPPAVNDTATQKFDGRKIPIIIVLVRNSAGLTQLGVLTRLMEGNNLIDQSYTNVKGFSLLKYNRPVSDRPADNELNGLSLTVEIPGLLFEGVGNGNVTFTDKFHIIKEITVTALPLPKFPVPPTPTTPEVPLTELEKLQNRVFTFADNPLDRLPPDFDPSLITTLESMLGNNGGSDPLQQLAGSTKSDFRTRRLPIVTQFSFIRNGKTAAPLNPNDTIINQGGAIKRYAVRIRQEWTFLGYTLGELAEVKSLDPGTLLNQATSQTQHNVENISNTLNRLVSQITEQTNSGLSSTAEVNTDIGAGVGLTGGITGFLGGLFGGIFGGGGASVGASVNTHNNVDTTLQVNQSLRVTKDAVNENVKKAFSTLKDLKNVISSAVSQVSPLLSRVTNLLRWTMYENYAVSNTIESVNEIQSIRLTEDLTLYQEDPDTTDTVLPVPGETFLALFSIEEIIDNRRIFERGLLDRRLAREFDVLARGLESDLARERIRSISISVNYSALIAGADLVITLQDQSPVIVTLRPGDSSARGSIRLNSILSEQLLEQKNVSLSLSLRPDLAPFGFVTSLLLPSARVQVLNVRLGFGGINSVIPSQNITPTDFTVNNSTQTNSLEGTSAIRIAIPDSGTESLNELNPLFRHINKNQHHYFRLLMEAALKNPELRDDSAVIRRMFPSSHPFWRLPIQGFEGANVLILTNAAANDPNIPFLLGDGGAATIIQLAAPGHYAEALQGLLQLADAAGMVHPSLLQNVTDTASTQGNALNVVNNLGDGLQTGGGVTTLPGTGNTGTGGVSTGGNVLPVPLPLPSFP